MEAEVRVLHVDGDSASRERAAEFLTARRDRFGVETAARSTEALERLGTERYDCVVSAYDLPELDGIEFLRAVREECQGMPFILFAGEGSEEIASEAISADVTDYLRRDDGTERLELLATRVENTVSQHRAERRLERQRHLFETAQEVVDFGAWEVNLQNEEGWWTSGVNQIYDLPDGYDPVPGDALYLLHPDDRPTVETALHDAIHEGEPYDLQFRLQIEDETRWARGVGKPQETDDEVTAVRGILQDITSRKQRQAVLKGLHRVASAVQTEETIEDVCERVISAAVDILDFELCAVLVREGEWLVPYETSSEEFSDVSQALMLDQGIAGKTYRTGQSYIVDDLQESEDAAPPGEAFHGAVSVPVGDHGVFQAVSTEPGTYDRTDLEYAKLLVSHAATAMDRIDREQKLRRQNERLEEFASIVSHDLRNPLNVAQLRLHLAREQFESEELESVAQAHDRMEQLIEDLLTLARAGRPISETEPVSLPAIVKACWRNVETSDATLVTDLEGTVQASESPLQQLLENLIRNSVEHGGTNSQADPDGEAETTAQTDSVTVTIGQIDSEGFYVADDGPGIPEDKREKIFDSGYTTQEDGSGFGLAIVEDVAEAHDWEIELTESVDGGVRFEVTSVTFTTPDG